METKKYRGRNIGIDKVVEPGEWVNTRFIAYRAAAAESVTNVTENRA